MAAKPLTDEAIAMGEKKMGMTLDDIIKMSKTNAAKPTAVKPWKQRVSNKNQRFPSGTQVKSMKIRQYMDSRSTLRQGAFAQRRSSYQGNSFSFAVMAARKAAVLPFCGVLNRSRVGNWSKPRPAGPVMRQGNSSNGGNGLEKHQQFLQTGNTIPDQKPRTLDSLFANMKEQRRRTVTHPRNTNVGHRGYVGHQHILPWLRGRYGNYRN